jgi:hypothetical protein
MAHGVCGVLGLMILLTVLGLFHGMSLMFYYDNKATIEIANNLVQHDQTKHIKERLDKGIICMHISYKRIG